MWVKDVFLNTLRFQTVDGGEALYFLNVGGSLHGDIITHVYDFNLAGTEEFVKKVIEVVEKELTIFKIEEDTFCFTALDIKVKEDNIKVSMEDYSRSLKDVTSIRKVEDR